MMPIQNLRTGLNVPRRRLPLERPDATAHEIAIEMVAGFAMLPRPFMAVDFIKVIGGIGAVGAGVGGTIELADALFAGAGISGPGVVDDKTGGKDQGEQEKRRENGGDFHKDSFPEWGIEAVGNNARFRRPGRFIRTFLGGRNLAVILDLQLLISNQDKMPDDA